jgi:hypothetical protein
MKMGEFLDGLAAIGSQQSVTQFLAVACPSASKTVAAFSKSIEKALQDKEVDRSASGPTIESALDELGAAEQLASKLLATAFVKDCVSIEKALRPFASFSAHEVAGLIAEGPKKKPKAKKSKKTVRTDQELSEISERLAKLSGSSAASDLINELADKSKYSVNELKKISSKYLGYPVTKVTHARLVEKLHLRNQDDVLDKSRQRLESNMVM